MWNANTTSEQEIRKLEIRCVPMCGDPCGLNLHGVVLRQPLPVPNSKVAASQMRRANATFPRGFCMTQSARYLFSL